MSGAVLEFQAVSKWYGQVSALTEVAFRVEPGVTGLVGQNGAGKSTLMKLACGLLRPSLGLGTIGGDPPTRAAARSRIGYCPDLDRFYESMSGVRFVTWMLRLTGAGRRDAARRAAESLDRLGLGDAMHRRIAGYSKGMRQRVKLAQALAHEPDVVLLDEPLTGLDPVARKEIGGIVREMAEGGAAVLVSSHVLHELQAVAQRFVLMHQGRLMAEGSVAELRDQMADRPLKVALASDRPRALAARLCDLDGVEAVRFDDESVVVDVRSGATLWPSVTEIGAEPEGLVLGVRTLDDDLESVFGYLVT